MSSRTKVSINLLLHTLLFAVMFVFGLYMIWHTSTHNDQKTAWWSLLLVGVAAGGFIADWRLYRDFRAATAPGLPARSTNDTELRGAGK